MPAPQHSIFYRPDALPDTQPTVPICQSTEGNFAAEKLLNILQQKNWQIFLSLMKAQL